jgi:hypothetical protein
LFSCIPDDRPFTGWVAWSLFATDLKTAEEISGSGLRLVKTAICVKGKIL